MPRYRTLNMPKKPGVNRRLEVEITEEIINTACVRDSSHCMIADAIKAAHPDVTHVSVDLQSIRFTDPKKGLRYLYLTPGQAQLALLAFDKGERVEPFLLKVSRPAQITASRVRGTMIDAVTGEEVEVRGVPSSRKTVSPDHAGEVPTVLGGQMPPVGPLPNTPGKLSEAEKAGIEKLGRLLKGDDEKTEAERRVAEKLAQKKAEAEAQAAGAAPVQGEPEPEVAQAEPKAKPLKDNNEILSSTPQRKGRIRRYGIRLLDH